MTENVVIIEEVIEGHTDAFGGRAKCIVDEYIYNGENALLDGEDNIDYRLEPCSDFVHDVFTIRSPEGLIFTICQSHVKELEKLGIEMFKSKYGKSDGLYWDDWDADGVYPSEKILEAILEDTSRFGF